MKLVTFVHRSEPRLGALRTTEQGERVFDLHALDPRLPTDILAFLEAGEPALVIAREALAQAQHDDGFATADVQT